MRFTGVVDQMELARLYNAADVFVFPSKTDTFGLVLLEALACGCPVAAYPVTGPGAHALGIAHETADRLIGPASCPRPESAASMR